MKTILMPRNFCPGRWVWSGRGHVMSCDVFMLYTQKKKNCHTDQNTVSSSSLSRVSYRIFLKGGGELVADISS